MRACRNWSTVAVSISKAAFSFLAFSSVDFRSRDMDLLCLGGSDVGGGEVAILGRAEAEEERVTALGRVPL